MDKLEKSIGYRFSNPALLKNALTHSSYANENKAKHISDNERLEFLGDSILGFLCADYLFQVYKELPEGELTKLRATIVCEHSLVEVANQYRLSEYLLLGKGQEASGGRRRPSILADAVEALLAAIYLDGGLENAKKFAMKFIKEHAILAQSGKSFQDYKTALQEIVQKNREETLTYRLKEEKGPDHDKTFVVEVLLNSNIISEGSGRSKKEAEQMAAKAALELMGQ